MPSVSPTDPGLLEGSPPPSVSPAGCVELEGSLAGLGDMPLTSQCSVESLGSLDSGHSSSAGNGATESHAGSPSPGPIISTPPPAATSPMPSAFSTPTSPRTHLEDRCDSSGRISVASMGSSQDRPPSGINRSLSNTSTASVASTDTVDTINSTDTINSAATSATNNTSTSTSTSTSSTTIVTPIKSKEELDSYIDHLDSLWSQEDEWIMIFDNLIRNTEASTRSRRHTHHYSHYHNSGTTSNHSSPYHSPYKKGRCRPGDSGWDAAGFRA